MTPGRRSPIAKDLGRRIVVALLLGLGVAEPIAVLMGKNRTRLVARMSTASNCPLVFNQVKGIEFWANRYTFEIQDREGRSRTIKVTRQLLQRIRGPHTRKASFIVGIGLIPITDRSTYVAPLVHAFCEGGPLARDLGLPLDLQKLTIHIESPLDHRTWDAEISCAR